MGTIKTLIIILLLAGMIYGVYRYLGIETILIILLITVIIWFIGYAKMKDAQENP